MSDDMPNYFDERSTKTYIIFSDSSDIFCMCKHFLICHCLRKITKPIDSITCRSISNVLFYARDSRLYFVSLQVFREKVL